MDERTLLVEEGERTQMVGSVACPVCGSDNASGSVWCADCGFRLDSTPGEAAEPGPRYALTGGGQRFTLKSGENVVGRLNADVFLSDPSVSRRHAVVLVGPSGVTVRVEDSSNGTRMNSVRMAPNTESPLLPGETVQFGAVALTLEAPEGVEVPVPPARVDPVSVQAEARADDVPARAMLTNGVDTWPIREGTNTVGRRGDNDVVIPDPAVSGRHATITLEGGYARVSDAGSTNGTFLNEQRLIAGAEQDLPAGAILRFGPVALNYEEVPLPDTSTEAGTEAGVEPEVEGASVDMAPGSEAPPAQEEADAG